MRALILICVFVLSACASKPDIDRVQKVTEYVTVPEDLLVCPPAPVLTRAEIVSLETETDYNEKFVLPLWIARNRCAASIEAVREFNAAAN